MRLLAPAILAASLPAAAVNLPDTFVQLAPIEARSLDPASAYNGVDLLVVNSVYEGLIGFAGESVQNFVPVLSEQVPSLANGLLSADGKTYRFPIRKGVRFHEGGELTPEDVRHSLLRFILFDRSSGPSMLLGEPVLGLASTRGEDGKLHPEAYARAARAISVEGDAVVVRLPNPFAGFLSILAAWGRVQDKEWLLAHGDWDGRAETLPRYNDSRAEDLYPHEHANGTGPFRLERWDRQGKAVYLLRNEGYRAGRAALRRAIVRTVEDDNTRVLMLKAGDADAVYLTPARRSLVSGLDGVRVSAGLPLLDVQGLFFNHAINPERNGYIGSGKLDGEGIPPGFFADRDVRLAFAYCLDYERLLRESYAGSAERATGFLPRGMLGYRGEPLPYRYDPAKAAEHFRAAFGGKLWERGFKLILAHPTSELEHAAVAQQLRRTLAEISPKFALEPRPVNVMTLVDDSKNRRMPLRISGWLADYADPHNFAQPMLHSKGYFQTIYGYRNAELDGLIEAALREPDPAKRVALYDRAHAIAIEDVPAVFTHTLSAMRVERDWLEGFIHNPLFPGSPHFSPLYDLSKRRSR